MRIGRDTLYKYYCEGCYCNLKWGGAMEREELFAVFKKAIDDEEKAYEFYLKAAENALEPEIKKTFETLAKDELYHSEKLKEKYRGLRALTS